MANSCRVRKLAVQVHLNPNLRTARYIYDFTIDPANGFDGIWREVFAYPLAALTNVSVRANANSGLKWELTRLNTPDGHGCLTIVLDGAQHFAYEVETGIESAGGFSAFGGEGCVAYWTSLEYPCDLIEVAFHLPTGVEVLSVNPAALSQAGQNPVRFAKRASLAMEFFLVFLTVNKKFLGMKPSHARRLENAIWTTIGAVLGAVLSLLFA